MRRALHANPPENCENEPSYRILYSASTLRSGSSVDQADSKVLGDNPSSVQDRHMNKTLVQTDGLLAAA